MRLRNFAWGLGLVLTAFYLSWLALAAANFAYPLFYQPLGLEQNIETYGPRNAERPGFHMTSREERFRLFTGIAQAVRNDGRGLQDLRYHDAQGRELGLLLVPDEVLHLQDVARLIGAFERVGLIALIGWLLLSAWLWRRAALLPSVPALLGGVALVLAVSGLLMLIVGPTTLFYWLHEVMFPPDHPWFFYYEESLMSMMMRAPVLFGGIAVLWLLLALMMLTLLYVLARRLLARRFSESHAKPPPARRASR